MDERAKGPSKTLGSSTSRPLFIDDDDKDDENDPQVICLDLSDEKEDGATSDFPTRDQVQQIDLTLEDAEDELERQAVHDERASHALSTQTILQSLVADNLIAMSEYEHQGQRLKAGKTVQLTNGDFLFIQTVGFHETREEVIIRGLPLQKASKAAYVSTHKGELVFIYNVCLDDPRSLVEQNLTDHSLSDIITIRILRRTNAVYPEFNEPSRYTARWKLTNTFRNQTQRKLHQDAGSTTNFVTKKLEMLDRNECTKGYIVNESMKRFFFRDVTYLGGASIDHDIQHIADDDQIHTCAVCLREYTDNAAFSLHQKAERKGPPPLLKRTVKRSTSRHQIYTFGDYCKSFRQLVVL